MRRRRQQWQVWLLVAAVLAVRIALLDGTPRANEWREVETATIARNFVTEPDILYPRINWGAPGPGYVETEFQAYPFAVHLLSRWFGDLLWLGQLVSLLVSAASCLQLFRLARRLLPHKAALLAVATFASSYLQFRYAGAFMPDATALLCYLTAAERFLCHLQTRRQGPLYAAGAAMAAAILVKPTTIHLGLWCCLLVWQRSGLRAVFAPRMLAFGAIALLLPTAFYVHAASLHARYGNTFGVISGGDYKWGGPAWWFSPHFYRRLAQIDGWLTLGLGGCILAAIGLWRWRARWFQPIIATWFGCIFAYYLIVARYASDETAATHYHIFAVPPAALAMAAGAQALPRWLRHRGWRTVHAAAVAAVLIAGMFAQQWHRDWNFSHAAVDPLYHTAGLALARVSQPGDLVVVTVTSTRISHGVVDNFEDPRVLYYAWRRGRLVPADELTAAHLQAALRIGARWLVVLDQVLPRAQPDFLAALQQLSTVARGDGYCIYRVDD